MNCFIRCAWYNYNKTTGVYQAVSAGSFTIQNAGTNINCVLTAPVTVALLSTSFACSVTSSATNLVAYSDPITFIPIGMIDIFFRVILHYSKDCYY